MAQASWTWKKEGNNIIVDGLTPHTSVSLYDAHGILLQHTISRQGKAILSIPPIHQMLILKVGGNTIKLK